jgi:hypothetical protein
MANQNRKLISAQWSMEYRVQSQIDKSFIYYCDPATADDGAESTFCAEGYTFFTEDITIYSSPYFEIALPDEFLFDNQFKAALYGYVDEFFLGTQQFECLEPYYDYINAPEGDPFDLEACMVQASTYSAFDDEEGTLGPLNLVDLAALAGPYELGFVIDTFQFGGSFPTRTILLTGTASITYTYAPIPLPAALPLLLGALGALGLAARRRRG